LIIRIILCIDIRGLFFGQLYDFFMVFFILFQ